MENKRIKILFLVSSLCIGGAEKHLVTLLNHLDPSRFRLSLSYLKDDPTQLPQLDAQKIEGRITSCSASKKIDFDVIRKLAQQIVDEEIEIIVCVNTYPLLYGCLARLRSGRRPRIVEVFHTTELSSLKDQLQMLFYRPFFSISDMLIYVCENQRKYWRARALRAKNDAVIHNGIDTDYFSDHYSARQKTQFRQDFAISESAYLVGLCAAMRPEKSHGDMLQAIALLRAADLNVECLFIGDGPERANIERRIDALGLARHIKITGYLPDVRLAVSACDAMAIVSHYVETFSLATLEAMALGKPVIMSNIGGAEEQINHGENGYLYERGDITRLAEGIKLLMDARLRDTMGRQARASMVKRFSLPDMIATYDRLFSSLAGSRQARIEAEATDAI